MNNPSRQRPRRIAEQSRPSNGAATLRMTPLRQGKSETDLSPLRGRSVVVVLDDANIDMSLNEQYGSGLSYTRLAKQLVASARHVELISVVSVLTPGQQRRMRSITNAGWTVKAISHTNVDVALGYTLGTLATRRGSKDVTWIIGSGDRELTTCCVSSLVGTLRNPQIATLSVRSTTARALIGSPMFRWNSFIETDMTLEGHFAKRSSAPDHKRRSYHV